MSEAREAEETSLFPQDPARLAQLYRTQGIGQATSVELSKYTRNTESGAALSDHIDVQRLASEKVIFFFSNVLIFTCYACRLEIGAGLLLLSFRYLFLLSSSCCPFLVCLSPRSNFQRTGL